MRKIYIYNQPNMKPEIRKLKSGVTLVLAENKSTEAVSLVVHIGAGTRFEDEKVVGITHFLEHILFDGTKKRPTSLEISKELDAIGADVNAHPLEEFTSFHVKSASEHLEKVVDIFSDMLLNSRLTEEDIEKEKRVIIEEIKMRTDQHSNYVFNVFDQAIFAGNTLARYGGGEIDKIKKIKRDDVVEYYNKHYLADNVCIAVCGNFAGKTADQISELIEAKFAFPAGTVSVEKSLKFDQKKLKFVAKDCQQTNMVIGYYGCAADSPDRLGLNLLSIILGGNMSSRMFTEIREKKGLAYDVRTFAPSISDIGTLATITGVADEKAGETLEAIIAEFEKIKLGVSEDELEKAKSFLLGQMKIGFEDSFELADFYLTQYFNTKKIETLLEISEKIAKITTDEIKKIAEKYIQNDKLSVAVIAKENVRAEIEKVINNLQGA